LNASVIRFERIHSASRSGDSFIQSLPTQLSEHLGNPPRDQSVLPPLWGLDLPLSLEIRSSPLNLIQTQPCKTGNLRIRRDVVLGEMSQTREIPSQQKQFQLLSVRQIGHVPLWDHSALGIESEHVLCFPQDFF